MKKVLIALSALLPCMVTAQQPDDSTACDSLIAGIDFKPELRESPSEINPGDGVYSAPLTAVFTSDSSPSAASFIWSIYRLNEHANELNPDNLRDEQLMVRYTGKSLRYTFDESGSYRIKLTVSDSTTTCTAETFYPAAAEPDLRLSDSFLDAPNVFSPGASPGVNDEFRVAYRSIVSFKGWIFNRWGKLLFHWTDPAQGWDGKAGGRLVQPGVYFYVMEAKGADGVERNKKGHINVLQKH
jgi:gliding motility-associated-like protein